jgi:hypothetical protein
MTKMSQPSRHVWRKGAPLGGAEEQTARAISAYAQYARLLSLQMPPPQIKIIFVSSFWPIEIQRNRSR